jgi:ribosomal protein L4
MDHPETLDALLREAVSAIDAGDVAETRETRRKTERRSVGPSTVSETRTMTARSGTARSYLREKGSPP